MAEYLRFAMRDCIANKDTDAGRHHADVSSSNDDVIGECPVVVFVNSKSGGRHGTELKARLQDLMGQEQVF